MLAAVGSSILGLAGLQLAVWYLVTGRIAAAVPDFVTAAATEGWTVDTGMLRRSGWPWTAAVEVQNVAMTRNLGGTAFHWTAERILLSIAPRAASVLRVEAQGRQSFKVDQEPEVPVTADLALLLVPLQDGPRELRMEGVVAGGKSRQIRVETIAMTFQGVAIAGNLEGVALAPPLPTPFDGTAKLSVRILATRPFPPAANPAQSAAAWQAAGGRIEVPEFVLDWGALSAEGTGSGGLDPLLQPWGQATIRARGAPLVLDAAARGGLVQAAPASAARAVLGLLSLGSGGGPVVLPIVLQDRTLTVAQFALVRLPIVVWGSP